MALYRHFANKDELIDGIVDLVFGEIELPVAGDDWRTRDAPAGDLGPRRRSLRHRWAIGLMESRRNPGPANLRHHDAVIGSLRAAGFDMAMVAHAYSLLDGYIYGFALTKMNLPFEARDDIAEMAQTMLEPFPPSEYPNLVAFITEHAMQPGYDFGDEFEYGPRRRSSTASRGRGRRPEVPSRQGKRPTHYESTVRDRSTPAADRRTAIGLCQRRLRPREPLANFATTMTAIAPSVAMTMLSMLMPLTRAHLEHVRRDEAADEAADDAEDDHHQQALTRAHDLIGQEAGDGADDDPGDETHLINSFRSVPWCAVDAASRSGRLAPEDADAQITISSRMVQPTKATTAVTSRIEPAGMEGVRPEDPLERRDEHLADVEDRRRRGRWPRGHRAGAGRSGLR